MEIVEKIAAEATAPPVLYYYATSEGLIDIVTYKKLPAPHVRYMHKDNEFRYVLDIIRKTLNDCIEGIDACTLPHRHSPGTGKTSAINSPDTQKMARLYEEIKGRLESIDPFHIFVCTFTANGDALDNWQCRNTEPRKEYSIGFSITSLLECAFAQGFLLAPCISRPAEQQKIILNLLNETKLLLQDVNIDSSDWILQLNNAVDLFMVNAVQLSVIFKHPALEDAMEWRLCFMPKPLLKTDASLHFKSCDGVIVPYKDLGLADSKGSISAIRQIIVGPGLDVKLAKHSIELLFAARGEKPCPVIGSILPSQLW